MIPNRLGQIAKFNTLLEGENPTQQYVILELHEDVAVPRAKIQALNTGLAFAPISIVKLNDLKVVEISSNDLLGQVVYIKKSDFSKVLGKVVKVGKDVNLELSQNSEGVNTNVVLTIVDKEGIEHSGNLFVNQ